MIFLTFDDGPYHKMTRKYVDLLKSYDIPATFFFVAERIPWFLEDAKSALDFPIGSHSLDHKDLTKLSLEELRQDFKLSISKFETNLGIVPRIFRPPYAAINSNLKEVVKEFNMEIYIWDVDPEDWKSPEPEIIIERVLGETKDGSIILLHDGHKNTLRALPGLIEELSKKFEFGAL